MSATTILRTRIDPRRKARVEKILDQLGIATTGFEELYPVKHREHRLGVDLSQHLAVRLRDAEAGRAGGKATRPWRWDSSSTSSPRSSSAAPA